MMPRAVSIRHAFKQTALGLLGMMIAWAALTAIIAVGMTVLDDVSAGLEEGHSQPCSQVLGAGASKEDRAGTCGMVTMGEDGGED